MELSPKLHDIPSFGGIDADADELLKACFQDHPAYRAVLRNERFLVLGRKGAGKTAIFKRLITDRSPSALAYGHTFDDYPWYHHDLQAQQQVPVERRYIHSWKYLILLSAAKLLLNQDSSQPWDDGSANAMVALEDFVVDSYGSRDPDLRQLFNPGKQLKFRTGIDLKLFKFEAETIELENLPVHIAEVNRAMSDVIISALNPDITYYICFDQLDLGFNPDDDSYSDRLIGLLLAAKDLHQAARSAGKRLNPVIFLRDDIYQDLRFEDKNKITENSAIRVAWSESNGELTLRRLMERRFSEVLGDGEGSVRWDDVFDPGNEMPSRQTKYRHICDRTFLRPRDMIKFCNEVLIRHQETGASGIITNNSIHAARDGYSDYLLNELEDEIAKHVPRYNDFLEVLKGLGAEKFEFEDFADVFEQREELAGTRAKDALEQLFEFSVISYLKPGGRGGGSEYVWRYKDPRARFDSSVPSYRVHPGFKEALGFTR